MSGARRCFCFPALSAAPAILALCLCFAAAAVLSGAWIALHADHVHDHDGAGGCCSVCARIAAAWDALKQLGAASGYEMSAPAFLAAVWVPASALSGVHSPTLAELKVRMNN
jgi:hypothetical protein